MLTSENDQIFISIASYCDPQLLPTVHDLLSKATRPDRLSFGICWQHDPAEPVLPFAEDPRFRILDIDWRASKGACWARAETMSLWQGEEWFLQVDSHCRFAPGWDETLIDLARQTGSPKPIITTYGSPFTPAQHPGEPETLDANPMLIAFQTFTEDKIPELRPVSMVGWRQRTAPMRARFLGAGFVFAPGQFVEEVPYDPELYFYGEESTMTLRAFTHGYDLYHPHVPLVWHDYIRNSATRHWDNHTPANEGTFDWSAFDARSKDKVRRLLAGEPVGRYGLGETRSLQDYESYAGISLTRRKAQDYTRHSSEPPNPPAPDDWADSIYDWIARITFDFLALPVGALADPRCWFATITDRDHNEIYRREIPPSELATISGEEDKITLICEFQSGTIPERWTVQPLSRSAGWLRRLAADFREGQYAILLEDADAEENPADDSPEQSAPHPAQDPAEESTTAPLRP